VKERVIHLLSNWPHELTTVILAMAPVSELRGSIPYAIVVAKMPWQEAYVISVLANFLPVIPILLFIGPVSEWLRRFAIFDRFFTWLFARTRRKGRLIERFEVLGLALFVAIPLPVTGAWTGSLAAFIFGVKKRTAFPTIFVGIGVVGVIVTLASLGVISFWGIATGSEGTH
jgi:uncharacterized membrane protein